MMLVLLTIFAFNFEAGILKLEKKDSMYITKLLDSVRIYNDTMNIEGLYGTFVEDSNLLFLGGNVRLSTPNTDAKSDSLILREDGNIIIFMGACEIVQNKKDTLRAQRVRVNKDTLYATWAVHGNIVSKNIVFYADTLQSYDSIYTLLGRDVRVFSMGKDTLRFLGTYIRMSKDTVMSDKSSRIESGKYTIKGDTFFYYKSDSFGSFLGNVSIVWDSGMAKSDTAFFYLKDEKLDSLILKGKCHLEKYGKDNDIKLDAGLFRVFFKKDSLRALIAENSNGVLKERKKDE